jgi:hypothetical protein
MEAAKGEVIFIITRGRMYQTRATSSRDDGHRQRSTGEPWPYCMVGGNHRQKKKNTTPSNCLWA